MYRAVINMYRDFVIHSTGTYISRVYYFELRVLYLQQCVGTVLCLLAVLYLYLHCILSLFLRGAYYIKIVRPRKTTQVFSQGHQVFINSHGGLVVVCSLGRRREFPS